MLKIKQKTKLVRTGLIFFSLLSIIALNLITSSEAEVSDKLQVAPLNPQFLNYVKNRQQPLASQRSPEKLALLQQQPELFRQTNSNAYLLGYQPPLIDTSYLNNLEPAPDQLSLQSLPFTYDLRTLGKLTPVKNQGSCGCCWAFATYSSMESCFLPAETRDFSENNLKNTHGYDLEHSEGGNAYMSMAYLTRWSGPVNETDDPYNQSSGLSPDGLKEQKHVQEVLQLPDRDKTEIKNAIMTYGGVFTSMYYDGYFEYLVYNEDTHAYYDYVSDDWSYYGNNHAVTIVGWNDNYSRNNFIRRPSGNGAWIVKNSWGTGWGENGYFYVSYYDNNFGRDNFVFMKAAPPDNYQRKYDYDPYGDVINIGGGYTWMANVFTAAASEPLFAAGFYALARNTSYTLQVYTNVTGTPKSGTLARTVTGTCAQAGFHTITLPTPVLLTSGQKFSVVIKVTTPGYSYPIPMEARLVGYYSNYYDFTSKASSNAGESYISKDGTSWTDCITQSITIKDQYQNPVLIANKMNVCIKAYVRTLPTILVQPVSQTVDAERNVTFTVNATGAPALAYQWYLGGFPIDGATSATFTLNNVSPADNGNYKVVVTNAVGTITSIKATLTVRPLLPSPFFDLLPGTYPAPQNVSVFYPPEYTGVTIRYTTDGTKPTASSPVFSPTTPLLISKTTTLKANAWKTGYTTSHNANAIYTITGIVATPTFSVSPGIYMTPQNVSINCASPLGAIIRYTTDGSEPTISSAQYTSPIPLDHDTVLKAKAWKAGWENSATSSAKYTIVLTKVTAPTFTIASGVYPVAQIVTIKCVTPGATIRYTTDNSDPTPVLGTIGTTVNITGNCTLKAIAYKSGLADSDISSATYYIGKVAKPVFSPPPGLYSVPGSISISCPTDGATIRYTVDGLNPTQSSLEYTGPIEFTQPVVIKTRAYKTDMVQSAVVSGTYDAYLPSQPGFSIGTGSYPSEQTVIVTCGDLDATIRYTTDGTEPTAASTAIVSGKAVQIKRTKTLKAKAFKTGWSPSLTTSETYTVTTTGIVATPVFSPAPGTCALGSNLSLICDTADSEIRYTTDGTNPTGISTLYEGPISFTEPVTIKAKAFKSGMASSPVVTGTYTALLPQPVFTPGAGTFGEQPVTISCTVPGVTIRYTKNGTEPTESSTIAPGGIVLANRSMTLKAKAFKTGWLPSLTETAVYTINQVATPAFSLAAGTYTTTQSMTISCATTGAVVYYTKNGDEPTAGSPVYSPGTVINIPVTKTIKAIAVKSGMTDSSIKEATYTITGKVATPTFYCISKDVNLLQSSGTYASGLRVTFNCATAGAEIHYTTNGVEPALSDPWVASGSFVIIESTATLKAKAFKNTWTPSDTTTEIYAILQVATPEVVIAGGLATITCATPGAVIRYTTNGNDPAFSDPVYSSNLQIPMDLGVTLKAKAWKTGLVTSKIAAAMLQYTLTITNDGNGSTDPSEPITVDHGVNTSITATPAPDYHFLRWIQSFGTGIAAFGNANAANTTVKVTGGDATIRATFTHDPSTLTITSDGNGSVTPSGPVSVNYGASAIVTATPYAGYHFVNWTQTGGTGSVTFSNANAARTTVSVTGPDAVIRANFIPYHTLTVTNNGYGCTTPSGAVAVNNGASMTITGTPITGLVFDSWTKTGGTGTVIFGDANSANTTVTLNDGDATIKANFVLPLNTWVPGFIVPDGSKWYCFKATIGAKYGISWDEKYTSSGYTCDVNVSAYQKDLTTAYFTRLYSGYSTPPIITAIEDYVYIKVQGYSSSDFGTFAVKVIPQFTLTTTNDGKGSTYPSIPVSLSNGASTSITAYPSYAYVFGNWTQTGGAGTVVFGNPNLASTTVTLTGGDATIQANFNIDHSIKYSLTVNNNGNGSTTPSGSILVNNGISSVITASPNPGCQFVVWTKTSGTGIVVFGDATSADTTVTVTGGYATIQANFAENISPNNTWITGNITEGGSKLYCYPSILWTRNPINWDDASFGSGIYNCNVKVSAYRKYLSTAYFTNYYNGYNQSWNVTAEEDYVYLLVQGAYSSSAGSFAIKVGPAYNNLMVTSNYHGSVTPFSAMPLNGESTIITATPNAGCLFVNWTKESGTGTVEFGDASSANTTVTLTGGSAIIQANFIVDQTVQYSLTLLNPINGSNTPSGTISVNNGVSTTITATPNTGYHFTGWTKTSGTGTVVFGNSTSASTTVTVTSGEATIQANFAIN